VRAAGPRARGPHLPGVQARGGLARKRAGRAHDALRGAADQRGGLGGGRAGAGRKGERGGRRRGRARGRRGRARHARQRGERVRGGAGQVAVLDLRPRGCVLPVAESTAAVCRWQRGMPARAGRQANDRPSGRAAARHRRPNAQTPGRGGTGQCSSTGGMWHGLSAGRYDRVCSSGPAAPAGLPGPAPWRGWPALARHSASCRPAPTRRRPARRPARRAGRSRRPGRQPPCHSLRRPRCATPEPARPAPRPARRSACPRPRRGRRPSRSPATRRCPAPAPRRGARRPARRAAGRRPPRPARWSPECPPVAGTRRQ